MNNETISNTDYLAQYAYTESDDGGMVTSEIVMRTTKDGTPELVRPVTVLHVIQILWELCFFFRFRTLIIIEIDFTCRRLTQSSAEI